MIMDLWTRGSWFFMDGSYELAIKCFDAELKEHPLNRFALHSKGWALVKLGKYEEAAQCLKKSEKDVLSTFLRLPNPDIDKSIEEKKQLASFLDIMLEEDKFFQLITNSISGDKEAYKKIYIKSILITSLLYVDFVNEKQVATYTNEKVVNSLLVDNSPLRLSLITKSNDPKEGQTLLDYFYNKNNLLPIGQAENGAFVACFTFNLDHLNQFRLYGKSSKGIEAGGMSLVVNQYFFNTHKPDNSKFHESTLEQRSKEIGSNFDKSNRLYKDITFDEIITLPLFRCIYLDPDTKFISSIGQREEYTFYQNEEDKELLNDYQHKTNRILEEVRSQLGELKRDIENLDSKIVSELLLSLRYLTKDVSFKEEQECRVITVNPLSKAKRCPYSNKMYFDYLKLKDNENKSRVEKVIYGNNCFRDREKEEYINYFLSTIEKICPSERNKFIEEIDINLKSRNYCIKEFKDKMKQAGIENIESSKWLFV